MEPHRETRYSHLRQVNCIIFPVKLQAPGIFMPKKEDDAMKNPPGYGSIVDLGKGRRRPIAVRVPNGKKFNKQGKEIIDYKYLGYFERTKQGKQEAQIMLANYNAGISIEITPSGACPTFGELADIWLARHLDNVRIRKGEVSAQLEQSYRAAIKRCSPIHGKAIDHIRYQDIQDIADQSKSMSASTINNLKTALYGIFDLARKQKYIETNFINDVEFLYRKSSQGIHGAFTREEVNTLWKHSQDYNIRIVLIMIYTGMRIEEIMRIKKADVHMDEKYMTGGVKTAAGKSRTIPLADKIYPYVQELMKSSGDYLLDNNGHRYSRSGFLSFIWAPAMQIIQADHLPHDTRYTCASMMDRAGVNENAKRTILGHVKDGVTNKVYVQKDLQDLLDAINMI